MIKRSLHEQMQLTYKITARRLQHAMQGDSRAVVDLANHVIYESGYIYIARMDGTSFYKIGLSKDPAKRLFHTAMPPYSMDVMPPIRVVHQIDTNWMTVLERQLHMRYAQKRVGGEWFVLNAIDLLQLRGIKQKNYAPMTKALDICVKGGALTISDAA